MKATAVTKPSVEKIVVDFTPEEARALYTLGNWSSKAARAVAQVGACKDEPLRHASADEMAAVLCELFSSLQPCLRKAFPGVKG